MSKGSILFVDDDLDMLDFIELIFADYNIQIHKALDANSALAMMKSHPFEILITDLGLKDMNGVTFIKELQREKIYVKKIILFSAYEFTQTEISELIGDFRVQYINKDSVQELVDAVRSAQEQDLDANTVHFES